MNVEEAKDKIQRALNSVHRAQESTGDRSKILLLAVIAECLVEIVNNQRKKEVVIPQDTDPSWMRED